MHAAAHPLSTLLARLPPGAQGTPGLPPCVQGTPGHAAADTRRCRGGAPSCARVGLASFAVGLCPAALPGGGRERRSLRRATAVQDAALPAGNPRVVVAISGKRKTGKDYFYELLMKRLDPANVETRRFATPIKKHISELYKVDLASLETADSFKENFRAKFYKYDLEQRAKDPFVFAREVLQDIRSPILVISDLRQIGDYTYLQKYFGNRLILIRLDAKEALRKTRGYCFTSGVDDSPVECDLDPDRLAVPWTLHWENDGDDSKWPARLEAVLQLIDSYLQ